MHEPSEDDILSSIRRIIASGDATTAKAPPAAALGEEERLAAEWASLAEDSGDLDDMGGGSTRVLNQDEIDSLLGLTADAEGAPETGVALLAGSPPGGERWPMLDAACARLADGFARSLRRLTRDTVEIEVDRVETVRLGDFMNSLPLPLMLWVLRAEPWEGDLLAVTDSALIYSIVDVLFGGRRGTAAMRVEGRPFTPIEKAMVRLAIDALADDLGAAFAPIAPVRFQRQRVETNPRFAMIGRPVATATRVCLRVDMEDRGGRAELLIPHATLEPIRPQLCQVFPGERLGGDRLWREHMRAAALAAPVRLEATLGVAMADIGAVAAWRPGGVVVLDTPAAGPIRLEAPGLGVALAAFGDSNGLWAVEVQQVLLDAPPTPAPQTLRPVALPCVGGSPIPAVPGGAPAAATPLADEETENMDLKPQRDLGAVSRVKVRVSAVLGSAEMAVEDLLKIGRGAVVALDRAVGQPVDVCVNGRVVARGEVVVVDGRIGVTLTEMVSEGGA